MPHAICRLTYTTCSARRKNNATGACELVIPNTRVLSNTIFDVRAVSLTRLADMLQVHILLGTQRASRKSSESNKDGHYCVPHASSHSLLCAVGVSSGAVQML